MSEHNLYYIRVILFSNTSLVYLIKQDKSIVLHWISLNSLTNLLFMTYVGYCTLRIFFNKPWSYPLHAHKTLFSLYHLVLFLCLPACYHVHAPLLLDTPWMSLCSFVFNTMLNNGVIIWIFFESLLFTLFISTFLCRLKISTKSSHLYPCWTSFTCLIWIHVFSFCVLCLALH